MTRDDAILEISQLPQDEFNRVISNLERLEHQALATKKAIWELQEQLGTAPKTETATKEEKPSLEGLIETASLCFSCANPCKQQGPDTVTCRDYSQRTEKCTTCSFWDVDTCQGSEPCIGGEHFEQLESPGQDEQGAVAV